MSEYCNNFEFKEDNSDSFQFWQGLRGPYFTPSVDDAGNLNWTNNGGLPNPETKNIQGKGIQLSGYEESIEELPEDPQRGDAWAVGTEEPFECFAWFDEWIDLGPMFPPGPPGQDGQDGQDGQGVPAGGSAGQFLRKASGTDYDTEWYSPAAGDVSYDSSLTYSPGTVGEELSSQRNTLNQLDQNMAYVESGNTASRTYAAGDFISWKGTLYKASTAIPASTAFAVGTNLATVVDENGYLCGGLNILNDSFQLIEGTTSSQTVTTVNYPYGFNVNNTMVISCDIVGDSVGGKYVYFDDSCYYCYLSAGGIGIVVLKSDFKNQNYRILIKKIT